MAEEIIYWSELIYGAWNRFYKLSCGRELITLEETIASIQCLHHHKQA